ncbi:uncharacterized protein EV420DRAFT_654697 [Desarmillaria tabescens]|uniref:Uncharacterized protein n=1 Tax=Armillaria tabescens TaxID=1929756 RepID=A0AA39NJR1_ARMTA|nr:uncharacterized protein EV420DRAFT_654697 [Desarmillaria tabescens]KAK0466923.1 hypothetical protein EV420DRAFT_654697 [Desarmillaria tabescens]
MPQSIRGTLCESARKLGYAPVTGFEPLQAPEVVNVDEPRLSPIWFTPPGPPCASNDTDTQELPKTNIRMTRYRQRGRPREECEVTQEEALANMLAATSITSGPGYELGGSASSPSPRGEYVTVPRCLSMDDTPTPTPETESKLVQRSKTEPRGRKGKEPSGSALSRTDSIVARRSVPYSPYQCCPALKQSDRSRGARDSSPMAVVFD